VGVQGRGLLLARAGLKMPETLDLLLSSPYLSPMTANGTNLAFFMYFVGTSVRKWSSVCKFSGQVHFCRHRAKHHNVGQTAPLEAQKVTLESYKGPFNNPLYSIGLEVGLRAQNCTPFSPDGPKNENFQLPCTGIFMYSIVSFLGVGKRQTDEVSLKTARRSPFKRAGT